MGVGRSYLIINDFFADCKGGAPALKNILRRGPMWIKNHTIARWEFRVVPSEER
jgi:hypothetical protein